MKRIPLSQAMQLAIKAQTYGDLDLARYYYNAILKTDPKHPDANHNMGVLLLSLQKTNKAITFFKNALDANRTVEQFWVSYCEALLKAGQLSKADMIINTAIAEGVHGTKIRRLIQKLSNESSSTINQNSAVAPTLENTEILKELIQLFQYEKYAEIIDKASKLQKRSLESAELLNIIGLALFKLDKCREAINHYKRAIEFNNHNSEALNNMGIAYKKIGELENAINSYRAALKIAPKQADVLNNLGLALLENDQNKEALGVFLTALQVDSTQADTYVNYGVALSNIRNFAEAIQNFDKAIAIKNNFAEAFFNKANALVNIGQFENALNSYSLATLHRPSYYQAYNNIGNLYKKIGNLNLAICSYKMAIEADPNNLEAWLNGADAFEKWNLLQEMKDWLLKAVEQFHVVPPDILFLKAKLLWRIKKRDEAIKILLDIDVRHLQKANKADFYHLMAKYYESTENFKQAFTCFSSMNRTIQLRDDFNQIEADAYLQEVNTIFSIVKKSALRPRNSEVTYTSDTLPVFMIGFPRSGTTLLDTILRSHARIDVIEEQPILSNACSGLNHYNYADILDNRVTFEELETARTKYWQLLNDQVNDLSRSRVILDKFPLNLSRTPLINQLFPNAKIILAIRHPMDAVLSCWMQNFDLNPAMANMTELDRITEIYLSVMGIYESTLRAYNLNVHQIRYEDLLSDFKGQTQQLLSHLDLEWEDGLEDYTQTALNRGRINTPSYSQVTQPLYSTSVNKWRNYEEYLDKYSEKLAYWINIFGYDV